MDARLIPICIAGDLAGSVPCSPSHPRPPQAPTTENMFLVSVREDIGETQSRTSVRSRYTQKRPLAVRETHTHTHTNMTHTNTLTTFNSSPDLHPVPVNLRYDPQDIIHIVCVAFLPDSRSPSGHTLSTLTAGAGAVTMVPTQYTLC